MLQTETDESLLAGIKGKLNCLEIIASST